MGHCEAGWCRQDLLDFLTHSSMWPDFHVKYLQAMYTFLFYTSHFSFRPFKTFASIFNLQFFLPFEFKDALIYKYSLSEILKGRISLPWFKRSH